ncbi:MBL fold metallo-hydrolase, partial [candidate division KSB1 bacterium]
IQFNGKSILIDAGFSYRELSRRLKFRRINPEKFEAVFITHEHIDHVKGLGVFSRIHNVPIFINKPTLNGLLKDIKKDAVNRAQIYNTGDLIEINGVSVKSFSVSHDAKEPVGYTFTINGIKIGYATDLGAVTDTVIQNFEGISILTIEANHDVNMLLNGNYPRFLKNRIRSEVGHLSNEETGKLLKKIASNNLKSVCLAHLSKENNSPTLAYNSIYRSFEESADNVPDIVIAKQNSPTDSFCI